MGGDLRVATDTGASLRFGIETWDPAAKLAHVWVKVSSVPPAGTTIYLYYGNATATSTSNGSGHGSWIEYMLFTIQ